MFFARAQNGMTVLMHASYSGHADCVRLLLDSGADANAKDRVHSSAGGGVRGGGGDGLVCAKHCICISVLSVDSGVRIIPPRLRVCDIELAVPSQ